MTPASSRYPPRQDPAGSHGAGKAVDGERSASAGVFARWEGLYIHPQAGATVPLMTFAMSCVLQVLEKPWVPDSWLTGKSPLL
ncbi:hypothetical protein SSP24_26570 [Streptomyces spinoverrucosus]|uniref:Uncharacterized protein n=1 Tax=Streptomyces spinoverrucosus TaxID=284043 RepID=A0A4Y3VCX3_9ACTN|nr:hypothetical protein SSP24_26570 [Streptomyces spinoverrucosus]GHB96503.1 hypothetical protein GCM10010397_81390 [Streptomyces spinoverrucosus]